MYLRTVLRSVLSTLTLPSTIARRHGSSVQCFSVIYKENGDPMKVLSAETTEVLLSDDNGSDILVRMLASPIHPADINMIQGIYPVDLTLPTIGGYEGVGEVLDVGKTVNKLQIGDWVVPRLLSGWGTWKTYGVCNENDVVKVPNDIPMLSAATLMINPGTAYRMLNDFVKLSPGDVVIQNGANSSVGQAAIQIAATMGLQTVNIVRSRPDLDDLEASLKKMGATHVLTDKFVRSVDMKTFMKSLPQPKLALNCVSGKTVADLLKYLEPKGSLVTYGGMSKQPLMVPTGSLIFNDARLYGFWMSKWNIENSDSSQRDEMIEQLSQMVKANQLLPPLCQTVPLENFQEAIAKTMEPFTTQKQILVMN